MKSPSFSPYPRQPDPFSSRGFCGPEILRIQTDLSTPSPYETTVDSFLHSMEQLLTTVIPKELYKEAEENPSPLTFRQFFIRLQKKIPLFCHSDLSFLPHFFSLTTLCFGEHSHGVSRFIGDLLCRWLIPGKVLGIHGHRSLLFRFSHFEAQKYFITEYCFSASDEKEALLIKKNLPHFLKQLRLNILSVYYSRYILSVSKLSPEQKSLMIQENLSSLLEPSQKEDEQSTFDQMQNFLIKLSAEEKMQTIQKNLSSLFYKRPKAFDRNLFDSIYPLTKICKESFLARRHPRQVSRIIAYYYLFKKMLEQTPQKKQRCIIKVMRTTLAEANASPLLGILVTLHFSSETERLEQAHLLEAIQSCLSSCRYVKNSYLTDKREDRIGFFYLEIEKEDLSSFSSEEFRELRKQLSKEIKKRIANIIYPVFLPQNEEEILRNVITLSHQIRYLRDLPQVNISYSKQIGAEEICFLILLARVLRKESKSMKEYFSSTKTLLKYLPEEIKTIGFVKKKYPKEVNIFYVSLPTTPFFRKDFSLDLQKARQVVVEELTKVIGTFRDFNGGLLLKQTQAFEQLKEALALSGYSNDVLLETFFYSLKPAIMQGILPIDTLKSFFLLFEEALYKKFSKEKYLFKTLSLERDFLLMIQAPFPSFAEEIMNVVLQKKIPSCDLTFSLLEIGDKTLLGYILHSNDEKERKAFEKDLLQAMEKWKRTQES